MPSRKLRGNGEKKSVRPSRIEYWDSLPWKSVDVDKENLGEFEEAVFFGLEEVDGNSYILNKDKLGIQPEPATEVAEAVKESKTKKTKKRKADEVAEEVPVAVTEEPEVTNAVEETDNTGKKAKKVLTVEQKIEKYRLKAERKKKFKALREAEKGNAPADSNTNTNNSSKSSADHSHLNQTSAQWGGVQLNSALVESLIKLSFTSPTPIQTAAIPKILAGANDVVGAAETGSGKTLAFGLPILHSLIQSWGVYSNTHSPFALIIAPTRELAMQITSVLKEVCGNFKQHYRVEIVSIVGGMSEQKQRRQLQGTGKPVHVVVATPGRLCDMFADESIVAFQNMSGLRYLVVDEADRIMEDGHFAELHRVFSRITDHEKIVQEGGDPVEVAQRRKAGTTEEVGELDVPSRAEWEQQQEEQEDDDFDAMPSESDLAAARARPAERLGGDEDGDDEEEEDLQFEVPEPVSEDEANQAGAAMEEEEPEVTPAPVSLAKDKKRKARANQTIVGAVGRQTLLFSATAVQAPQNKHKQTNKKEKATRLNGTLLGIGQNGTLPEHLKKLLSMVAVQKTIHAVDVTDGNLARLSKDKKDDAASGKTKGTAVTAATSEKVSEEEQEEADLESLVRDIAAEGNHSIAQLPKTLSQYEIRVPTEEKDIFAYYYLLKHPGRSLLFVNSIKTARRVDGLLRALGVNCRTIHAQLQQRQRLRALDSFRSSPIGVLVATDVAARGLDIPKVQSVIHYDIARSPQVYIHRSGRTARANAAGTSVALPSPEDSAHHTAICNYLGMKGSSLPLLNLDLSCMQLLRERVRLAKKIFTQSFVASQSSKERNWLEQNANETGLDMDDFLEQEVGTKQAQQARDAQSKKALDRARHELKLLLDKPLDEGGMKRGGRGFFVYAK